LKYKYYNLEDFVLLGFKAETLANWFSKFRRN